MWRYEYMNICVVICTFTLNPVQDSSSLALNPLIALKPMSWLFKSPTAGHSGLQSSYICVELLRDDRVELPESNSKVERKS
jgi:hypothetical protein